MNNHMTSAHKVAFSLFLIVLILPMSACTVFTIRYRSWDRNIDRDEQDVASFALPYTLGDGETALLLVHGFGDSPQVWSKLAPELAEHGYTVRAMRLPAWGEPPKAKRQVTREDWFQAILDETHALQTDHKHVIILAHSMGGCLTTYMAQDKQLPVDGLILYAPMYGVSNERSPVLSTRNWFEIGDRILPQRMLVESLFPDHARVNPPRPRTLRDPFVPNRIYRILYDTMDALQEQSPVIPYPVRLVLPGEDRVVQSDLAETWFEALAAPSKTLHLEPEAGHVLPLDLNFSREANRIHIWIQQYVIQADPLTSAHPSSAHPTSAPDRNTP